jgi:hypothetical protein
LEEFDGTSLTGTYSGNCLKKFVERRSFYTLAATNMSGNSSESSRSDGEHSESSRDARVFEEVELELSSSLGTKPRRSGRL